MTKSSPNRRAGCWGRAESRRCTSSEFVRCHSLVDGNKRTGYFAAFVASLAACEIDDEGVRLFLRVVSVFLAR
ncbi:hypothetical protein EV130_108151 [Rhizobium azibense]|uniref:Fido domain-containing protein n=1 Tax=Rhizobium azibense TaxID=1136135 RepID=A0A4R3QPI7_9HYPH|nr:hypothetical protein EV130_108151 [Rhizobium azibense]